MPRPDPPVTAPTAGPVGAGMLFAMIRERACTRAELLERSGLSRSTLATRLESLGGLGLVRETAGVSTGGRPAALLTFEPAAGKIAIAIVGHTRTHAAITDLGGTVLAEEAVEATLLTTPPSTVAALAERWDALLASIGTTRQDVWACVVSVPASVDAATGTIVRPLGLSEWDGVPLGAMIEKEMGAETLLDNDVNVMALGERALRWSDVDDLILVRMGTGIGAGIVSNGEIVRGARGAGGGLAHIQVGDREEPLCRCGARGCLDMIASGTAIAQTLTDAGIPTASARDITAHIRAGLPEAISVVREAGRATGQVLSGLINALNPSIVVVGGRLTDTGQYLLAGIREEIYRRSTALATEDLQIVVAADADRSSIAGAGLLAAERLLSPASVDRATTRRRAVDDRPG